ncbi:MAG TPA: hypothetical protein VJN89_07930 [Candidatus Acidoferrum sp.]|nr:hypothetical protein [Candidatus Acidoferrum sp.]
MKKFVILSVLLLLAVFILLPGSGNGKYNVSKSGVAFSSLPPWSITQGGTLFVDGGPMPPFPPNPHAQLMADGGPMPPFPPKPPATLVADGGPMPPFPPNPHAQLTAEGSARPTLYA